MEFEAYLKSKKIDAPLFQQKEPARFEEWKTIFAHLHPNSFTEQKKFLINQTRRKYLLKD